MLLHQIPPFVKMAIGGLLTLPLMALAAYVINAIIPSNQIATCLSLLVNFPIFFGGVFLFFVGLVQNHRMHTNAYALKEVDANTKRCRECGGICEKQYRKCRHCGSPFESA